MAYGFTRSRDEKCSKSNLSSIPKSDGPSKLCNRLVDSGFVAAMHAFVEEGQRMEETPGFAKPRDERFPFMLELFSRSPETFTLADGQTVRRADA